MIPVWVELSGRNPGLGRAEAIAAAEALGGAGNSAAEGSTRPDRVLVQLPSRREVNALADRLALARRCLVEVGDPDGSIETWFAEQGSRGGSASFRELDSPDSEHTDPRLPRWVGAYKRGGGRIDLRQPERRFWIASSGGAAPEALEEVGSVNRTGFRARRTPQYPFQRPVTLDPRLARAAVNLARVRPGDRVVDPFVGTGSLLIEAALVGARVTGIDRDADMVRGALQNFAHVGLVPESMTVGDSAAVGKAIEGAYWDALVTDPPYGRASGTGREPVSDLLARTLPVWASHIRPNGRIVIIAAGGEESIPLPWTRVMTVSDRVHRSLTREFRVYEKTPAPTTP
ncbi:MAG: RsmD family RNA methyltransferase [Thermoplasmata archaeon]